MELKTYSCPNCGASVPANPELKTVSCNQCGTSFAVEHSTEESIFGLVNKVIDNRKAEKEAKREAERIKQEENRKEFWKILIFGIIVFCVIAPLFMLFIVYLSNHLGV